MSDTADDDAAWGPAVDLEQYPRAAWVDAGPPPPPIRAVELTQAVQHNSLDGIGADRDPNSIPLVADKTLHVRVFLSPDDGDWPAAATGNDLAVVVEVEDAGGTRGSDLRRFERGALAGGRAAATGSVNIDIPGGACDGDITLEIIVRATDKYGANTDVARHSLGVRFLRMPWIPVYIVPVTLEVGIDGSLVTVPAPEDVGAMQAVLHEAARPLPVPGIEIRGVHPGVTCAVGLDDLEPVTTRVAEAAEATTRDLIVVGLYGELYDRLGAAMLALTDFEKMAVAGPVHRPYTISHELGHVIGRGHTACGGQFGDPGYPVKDRKRPGAVDEYGFRLAAAGQSLSIHEVLEPSRASDYMGGGDPECEPAWTSAYGYRAALRGAQRCPWLRRRRPGQHLVFRLTVEAPDDATLGPAHVLSTIPQAPTGRPSDYSVQLVGERAVARLRRLYVLETLAPVESPRPEFPIRFVAAVPWDPAAQALVVLRGRRVVKRIPLAAQAPELPELEVVDLTESGPRGRRLRFASAPRAESGGSIDYLVRYSNDDGQSWFSLGGARSLSDLELALEGLPAGERCLLEVSASRAGRTAMRTIAVLRDPIPPRVEIVLPRREGDEPVQVDSDGIMELVGAAFSLDLPPPRGDALAWLIGGSDEPIAFGETITIATSDLPEGLSRIVLRASVAGGDVEATLAVRRGDRGSSSRASR